MNGPTNGIDFGHDGLRANRAGYLTEQQRQMIIGKRNFWHSTSKILLITCPSFILITIVDGLRIKDTVESRCGIIFLILVLSTVGYAYVYLKRRSFDRDLSKDEAVNVEGIVKLQKYLARNGYRYFIYIENIKFTVSGQVFDSFRPNSNYRIYYTPFSKIILSVEQIH